MSRAARNARGFTLVEILIAVTLLSVMVLAAMATISTSVRAVRSGEALVSRTDSVRVSQEFMRRQISQAMPLPFERSEDLGMIYVFEGDGSGLKFVAPMPGHLAQGGPHVQEIRVVRDGRGVAIEFDHALLNGYEGRAFGGGPRPPVRVLEGLERAEFEFRAVDESGELTDWMPSWDSPQFPPLMVRLVAEFPRDRPQRWPLFEVPVMSGANSVVGSAFGGLPYARPRNDAGGRRDRERDRPRRGGE